MDIDYQRLKRAVKWLIGNEKINEQQDLVGMLGYNKTYISGILNGKIELSSKFMEKFLEVFPEFSADWFRGKGTMLKSKATIGLMSEAEIAAQDAEVAAGTVQVGAEPPPAVANHPSYRRLLEAVQEQAAEVSKLQKDLIAAYKELNELRKKG